MTPSNENTSGLEPCPFCGGEAWLNDYEAKYSDLPPKSRAPQCRSCGASLGYLTTPAKATEAWNRRVTAASAQARIAELEAETDVLKVEVIGLRAAIFGSHDYDPTLRHGNFIEMARATEDGRQGAVARAAAAEARADRLAQGMPDLSSVIGWLANGCDPTHAVTELRVYQARIKAALQQEPTTPSTTLKGADQ